MRLMILLLFAYAFGIDIQVLLGFPTSADIVMWFSITHSIAQLINFQIILVKRSPSFSRFQNTAFMFFATLVFSILPGPVMEELGHAATSQGVYDYSRGCMGNPLTIIPVLVAFPVGLLLTMFNVFGDYSPSEKPTRWNSIE